MIIAFVYPPINILHSHATEEGIVEKEIYNYNPYIYQIDTVQNSDLVLGINPEDTVQTFYYIRKPIYDYNLDTLNLFLLTDNTGKLYRIESNNLVLDRDALSFSIPFDAYPFLFKTKDLRDVASILSIHHNFNNRYLYNGFLKGTLTAYKKNEILNNPLTTYLNRERTISEDYNLSYSITEELKSVYNQYYPWQGIIYEDQQLQLEKSNSYQAILANARTKANTASRNLQRATQQLASQQKSSSSSGLNAATIAAGLSDFIVESAQEELNMNFLSRMREQISEEHPEFQILFPNTLERFSDFQVTQYRSFLGTSKLAFQADLSNHIIH